MHVTRRQLMATALASAALPSTAVSETSLTKTPTEISWDDLIPPGVPYSEIIGEGNMDMLNDTWLPIFDENARKLNPELDGAYIKMPGFIIPIDISAVGVTTFILVPYVGACIHTPPPPANQLVLVTTETPWPADDLWDAVWVTGQLAHELQSTEVAEIGYTLKADAMEVYVW